ncbi:MAG: holo-ACP synthase [Eubacteriaceae bacterium]|nr:holo-ACP synthase [Eubacteriaceae bacterium]
MAVSFDTSEHMKGMGVDSTRISRFRKMRDSIRDRLARKILEESELAVYMAAKDPAMRLACFFSEKECISKTLGTGFTGISFKDIIIRKNELGRPCVWLDGRAKQKAEELGISVIKISLTHEGDVIICVSCAF